MELNAPSFVENASMSSGPSTNAGRHIPNSPAPEANAAIFPRAAAASPSAIPAAIASASAYEPSSRDTAAFSRRISETFQPSYL